MYGSSALPEDKFSDVVEGDFLWDLTFVPEQPRLDSGSNGLRKVVLLHEVIHEVVKTWDLIDESEVIQAESIGGGPLLWQVHEHSWSLLLDIDDQVFQLLLVHLEMFHYHVVAEPVTLVEVLPVVHVVSECLFV